MSALYAPRVNGHKNRISPLPSFSNPVYEKQSLRSRPSHWTTTYYFHVPGSRRGRRIKLILPVPKNIYQSAVHRWGRKRAFALFLGTCLLLLWTLLSFGKRHHGPERHFPPTEGSGTEPSTLVFSREDLQRVWEWEIASGHYPSSRKSVFFTHSFIDRI